MSKKLLGAIALIFGLGICPLHAQEPTENPNQCGTQAPPPEWDEWFNNAVEKYKAERAAGKAMERRTIPVIIHVIHAGEAVGTYPNLSNAQLVSQIKVLNDDFAGKGYNVGNIPAIWKNLVADAGVDFCLATKDPNGNILPEPGIDRIDYHSLSGITDPKSGSAGSNNNTFINYIDSKLKPVTIWDVTKYLNIWVTDRPSDGTGLGVANAPAGTTSLPGGNIYTVGNSKTDGLWCWAKCFGTTGTLASGYSNGRVSSHEIGHYLGLHHLWGTGNSTCETDYCNDTPPQSAANFNCPTFPTNKGKCSGNTTGEMTMNIMDYTNDGCKYFFTPDQVARIQTAMAESPNRKFLGTHGLCSTSSGPTVSFSANSNAICAGASVSFTDNTSNSPTAWKWTFNGGNPASSTQQNPSVVYNAAGSYSVKLVATNANGKDSVTKTSYIIVNAAPAAPSVVSGSGCKPGPVTVPLSATAAGSGTLEWYDAASGGNLVATGTSYSPTLTNTTTYYVSENSSSTKKAGASDTSSFSKAGGYISTSHGLMFNVLAPCTLKSVKVYAKTAGDRTIDVLDSFGGTVIKTKTVNVPAGESRVVLDFALSTGDQYYLRANSSGTIDMHRSPGGASFPYTAAGLISITESDIATNGNPNAPNYYYYFYDWEVTSAGCSSTRTPVTAAVDICNSLVDPSLESSITVFPNPNQGSFTIHFTAIKSSDYTIEITNILGQAVHKESLGNFSGTYTKSYNLDQLEKGVYLLTVRSRMQARHCQKLIVD